MRRIINIVEFLCNHRLCRFALLNKSVNSSRCCALLVFRLGGISRTGNASRNIFRPFNQGLQIGNGILRFLNLVIQTLHFFRFHPVKSRFRIALRRLCIGKVRSRVRLLIFLPYGIDGGIVGIDRALEG